MAKARYYVVIKSNWSGDWWKPTDGPFDLKSEAEAAAKQYEYHPHNSTGGIDIKSEIHARVVTRTELARMGFPNTPRGNAELIESIVAEKEDPSRPWNWERI